MLSSPKLFSRSDYPSVTVDFVPQDPTHGKIRQLHDRWQQIHHQIDREKQNRRDTVQQQVALLEERIGQKRQADQTRIAELKQEIEHVAEIANNERASRKGFVDERDKEFREVEAGLLEAVENQRKNIQEKEELATTETDEKIIAAMGDIAAMQSENVKLLEQGMSQARVRINQLETKILQDRKAREQLTTQVTENIQSDLNRLHNALTVQKKVRQDTQNKLFKMIDQVHRRLTQQLSSQRRQRQQMNQAMLQLLQQTCSKVQRNFR